MMESKRALFVLLLFILIVNIFWQGAIRTIAMRFPDQPWARGLLYDF